jgi:uncharacterized protein
LKFKDAVSEIPFLGSGLGYRAQLKDQIFKSRNEIDFLEIITDQFVNGPGRKEELAQICESFRVIPHGISLSIGSAMPVDKSYLRGIKSVSDFTESPYYSEHLCMTRAPGIDIGHLSPLWLTDQVLENTISNVSLVQDYLGKPLVLETITYLFEIPGATMTQPEFFHRLVESTNCGVLLDITNVFINSVNHHFDPIEFIKQMPLDKVVQVHLAGGFWSHGILVDGHSEPVHKESWELLQVLSELIPIRAVILEHDTNFPEQLSVLLDQVERARKIVSSRNNRADTLVNGQVG